jgi:hypothetical protein
VNPRTILPGLLGSQKVLLHDLQLYTTRLVMFKLGGGMGTLGKQHSSKIAFYGLLLCATVS